MRCCMRQGVLARRGDDRRSNATQSTISQMACSGPIQGLSASYPGLSTSYRYPGLSMSYPGMSMSYPEPIHDQSRSVR